MTTSILFELYNHTIRGGTGIATYARNLTRIAKELGFRTDGLFDTQRRLGMKDKLLAEIEFFDARKKRASGIDKFVDNVFSWAVGSPFGLGTVRLPLSGAVIEPPEPVGGFSFFDKAYTARKFMDHSRFHFKRYGSRATLRLPETPTIFHATQAIPLKVRGAINIYTIHDLVPLRLPYASLDDKKFFLKLTRHLARKADHIVTVSETSRRDLIEIAGVSPDRVTNTYQAVVLPPAIMAMTAKQATTLVERTFDLGHQEYFLFYGALEPKKNVSRLIDAYLGSGTKRPLVIAGGLGWEYEDDLARIELAAPSGYQLSKRRIELDRKVLRFGHLPRQQLVALARGARALLFPSLYEGFGLPVLEAMLLGTPVLTSNVASLTEVAGDAALLVDPTNVGAMTKAIARLDADADLRAELSKRGSVQAERFSPQRYKATLDEFYRKLLG